jgi:hypothetical protein
MIICSSSSDVSDRYNNLKAARDSLMETVKDRMATREGGSE